MQILISHPSPIANARLRNQLMAFSEIAHCATTTSLTEAYNFAKHHQPDCVIMSAAFADCAEFELLDTLFRILGIGCVFLRDNQSTNQQRLSAQTRQHVVCVGNHSDPADVLSAILTASRQPTQKASPPITNDQSAAFDPKKIILIGASTGGIDALLKTTQCFSNTCPPTLIVQHTGGSFANSLIRLLDHASPAKVAEAQDGAPLEAGHIYLAPGDTAHLCLNIGNAPRVSLQTAEAVSGHRPSIDALFHSAVPYAAHVTAALLTGMGRDGAQGLAALRQAGAHTIGQDEATSVVYGMPRVAKEMGAVTQELPLQKIGPALLAACRARARA